MKEDKEEKKFKDEKNKKEEKKKEEHQMEEENNPNRSTRSRINYFENRDRPKKDKSAIINSQVYEQNELPQRLNQLNRSRGHSISNIYNPFSNRDNLNQSQSLPPSFHEIYSRSLPSYNEILLNTAPMEISSGGYLSIRQGQEQINLLKMILNSVNDNAGRTNISKILILICFLVYYGYFAIHLCNADWFRYKVTKDLFYISLGFFIIPAGIFITNIYNSLKPK